MFLKNRNINSKIKRSKVTDYAALICSKNEFMHRVNCSILDILESFGEVSRDIQGKIFENDPVKSYREKLVLKHNGWNLANNQLVKKANKVSLIRLLLQEQSDLGLLYLHTYAFHVCSLLVLEPMLNL